jgi:hypothetical protein
MKYLKIVLFTISISIAGPKEFILNHYPESETTKNILHTTIPMGISYLSNIAISSETNKYTDYISFFIGLSPAIAKEYIDASGILGQGKISYADIGLGVLGSYLGITAFHNLHPNKGFPSILIFLFRDKTSFKIIKTF